MFVLHFFPSVISGDRIFFCLNKLSMEGLLKSRGRSLPARFNCITAGRRRLEVGELALASLFLTSGAMLAEVTSVEVSPLIAQSTLVGPVDKEKQISVALALPFSGPGCCSSFH
jgi:hypothetical protein